MLELELRLEEELLKTTLLEDGAVGPAGVELDGVG